MQRFSRTVVLLIAMGAGLADAEDAAQEAMILAWQNWASIREPAAWVRTTAIRVFFKQSRKEQNQAVPLEEADAYLSANPDLEIFAEEEQKVLRLLRALPPGQRTIAVLFYDGMSCEEIAEFTGKIPATIRSQLRHARKTLKELITSDHP